ncbi:MAG: S-layer homology domain-containing protein, partial [Peptoniphilus lacrimalis]
YTTALNADVKFTAKYTDKKVVIIPDDQDNPGTTPDGYVRVTFAPGTDGTFKATDKKVFDVLKGKTIQDAQAANPALAIPTVTANEGKTYEGWTAASKDYKKDLSDYTTALNADVKFTAKYTDNVPTTTNSEDYDPQYTGKSGKPGETVQIDAPTFTKKGVNGNVPAPTTPTKGTTFANNDPTQNNVTVDPNNGSIKVVIPQDAQVGSTITIKVKVTYPDNSNETVDVKVTVTDNTQPKPEEDKSKTPIVDPVDDGDTSISGKGEPGSDIIINIPGKDPIKTTVDDGGKWIAPIDPAHEGDVIEVIQIEVGKKPSDPAYVTVGGRSIIVPGHDDGGHWWFGGGSFKPVETEEQVIDKTEHGIHMAYIFGYKDHTFRCEGKITRAEAASMIAHIAKLDLSDNSKPDFKDTPSSWYNAAINAMVKKNLMFADKNGNFRPNEPITRGEFARAIQFIDKENKKEAPFMDIKGHEFEEAINQAYANGRISGYPDGTFKPDESITRAEAVTILNNFDGRMVRERGIEDVKKDLIKFTDLIPSHWAYYEIIEASNSHAYSRISNDSKEEKWSNLIK